MDTRALKSLLPIVALGLWAVALGFALLGLVLLWQGTANSAEFESTYTTILLINTAAVLLLVALIAVNFARLYRDYRRAVPGVRLKVRLVRAIVLLALVPMAVVYLYSLQFLSSGIESWFDVEVEQGLEDALELSREALNLSMRSDLEQTQLIAQSFYGLEDTEMSRSLGRLRSRTEASQMAVFAGVSRIVAISSSGTVSQLPELPGEVLLSLRRDGEFVSLEPLADDRYLIRAAVEIPGLPENRRRILQGIFPVDERMGLLAGSVQDTATRYSELAFMRQPLKNTFLLTLSIVVLLSVLIAVFGALFFTRRLIAPVQDLVAGTRAAARGEFDARLPQGRADEIGFLVDSFNDMLAQLGTARAAADRHEEQVEREREGLEAILARLTTGVIALDKDLRIRTVNAAASSILNVDLTRVVGVSVEKLAGGHNRLRQLVRALNRHRDAGEAEWREQLELVTEKGQLVLVVASTSLPDGIVLVFDDVTDLLQVQRDAAWGEVARRLAHEIKNPLTPIQLSAERLRRRYLNAELSKDEQPPAELIDRATNTIVQQVEAMRDMVNAFSEYARAPAINLAWLDLNQLIREVADLYPAPRSQPWLVLTLDEQLPALELDAVRMRQVLHNLIRNAQEALEGQPDPEVRISTAMQHIDGSDWAVVEVQDNGPGFPHDDRESLFQPYVTGKDKGTGLGLAIVRKLVEEHGGEVVLDSNDAAGACVRIVLPATGQQRKSA